MVHRMRAYFDHVTWRMNELFLLDLNRGLLPHRRLHFYCCTRRKSKGTRTIVISTNPREMLRLHLEVAVVQDSYSVGCLDWYARL